MTYIEPAETKIEFLNDDAELIFVIESDGTITKGDCFTTNDDMSLKFWDAVGKHTPHYFMVKRKKVN